MEATIETSDDVQSQAAPPARMREKYEQQVLPALIERFGYSTPMAAPRIVKVNVNMGCGEASRTAAVLDHALEQLGQITGQRPNVRKARKSIANFKLREDMPVGCAVTLRRARMWEFLDRLVSISAPRIRDFRGFNPRAFDGRGNYTLGVKEQTIFPEIDYDEIDEVRGLDVTVVTTAATDEEAFQLLLDLGFPFAQDGRPGEIVDDSAEEDARKEEARLKAEAEAAALEQLKEENPEAYAKPEKPDEDEEGEAEDGDGETPDSGSADKNE